MTRTRRPNRPAAGTPIRVVGYVRVSTDEQHQGPRAQLDAIRGWCERHGAELVTVCEDLGVSGGAPLDRRPGMVAALDALAELGAGAVLVAAKRDRLARDVMLTAMVERLAARSGGRVETADGAGEGEGPEAILMRRMVDAFAEYERELIRARTRAALAAKQRRGEITGTAPIGAKVAEDGRTLIRDEAEAEAVTLIRELRAAGVSVRGIAEELNRRGVTARGARWHPTTVQRVIARTEAA
jgi:DNA invertase Pin-like site-specific DNA recombinase